MTGLETYYRVGFAFGAIATLLVALGTWYAQPQLKAVRLWALLCLVVSLWFFARLMIMLSIQHDQAYFWQRVMYTYTTSITVIYFHFALALTESVRYRKFLKLGYVLAVFVPLINWTSYLFVTHMRQVPDFGFTEIPGPIYFLHSAVYLLYSSVGGWLLYQKKRTSDHLGKIQLNYVIWASAIGFVCGFSTFPYVIHLPYYSFSSPLVSLYAFIIAYAIVRHQLLDIRIIVRKTLVYSALTALLTSFFVATVMLVARSLEGMVASPKLFSSVAAAWAMALLFNPLRVRIQRFVDRHFLRESLDPVLLREATSGFVHEIKRPLANISLPAELGLKDLADLREGSISASEGLQRIEKRLRYILDQSMDAGKRIEAVREASMASTAPLESVDIVRALQKSVECNQPLANQEGVQLSLVCPENLPIVQGRAQTLEIVIGNLIKNAVEAMRTTTAEAKTIKINAELDGQQVLIHVRDNGPGIAPEVARYIFEPYFTTKGARGMGMGLYLCRQLLKMQGGDIETRREPGHGAVFRIRLPVADSPTSA